MSFLVNDVFPAGIVLPYAGTTAPAGWLLCDGTAISRTDYARLFSAIGTSHGYGNNSSTFNLPDYRGRFLRGVDGTANNDPDKASRTAMNTGGATGNNVGSVQGHQTASHNHVFSNYGLIAAGGGDKSAPVYSGGAPNIYTDPSSGGNETRPKNANVNYIIKI